MHEWKDLTYKRIKGLIEEYIGGRRKGITVNHIQGQIRSAIDNNELTKEGIEKLIGQIEEDVRSHRQPFQLTLNLIGS